MLSPYVACVVSEVVDVAKSLMALLAPSPPSQVSGADVKKMVDSKQGLLMIVKQAPCLSSKVSLAEGREDTKQRNRQYGRKRERESEKRKRDRQREKKETDRQTDKHRQTQTDGRTDGRTGQTDLQASLSRSPLTDLGRHGSSFVDDCRRKLVLQKLSATISLCMLLRLPLFALGHSNQALTQNAFFKRELSEFLRCDVAEKAAEPELQEKDTGLVGESPQEQVCHAHPGCQ